MRLLHYSSHPLLVPYSVEQMQIAVFGKPRGLWVSVEGPDDWPTWCSEAGFGEAKDFAYEHEIVLAAEPKILRITTAEQLLAFTEVYGEEQRHLGTSIDWAAVARYFHGIVIAPYQWECRLDSRTIWYYGWDCASGCIWNADAIQEIRGLRAAG